MPFIHCGSCWSGRLEESNPRWLKARGKVHTGQVLCITRLTPRQTGYVEYSVGLRMTENHVTSVQSDPGQPGDRIWNLLAGLRLCTITAPQCCPKFYMLKVYYSAIVQCTALMSDGTAGKFCVVTLLQWTAVHGFSGIFVGSEKLKRCCWAIPLLQIQTHTHASSLKTSESVHWQP